MTGWSEADIPEQAGRTAVVTGATGGVGFEAARALLAKGAAVVLASRDPGKGAAALARLAPWAAQARFAPLDLADLASVRGFAERLAGEGRALDLLIDNAGLMTPPRRLETAQGFERQMGVNHLGHFALTGLLLPLLRRGRQARVVVVSSLAHAGGRLGDPEREPRYAPFGAYARSKLANLLFVLEFERRSRAGGWGVAALGAHPGLARTDIGRARAGEARGVSERAIGVVAGALGQSAARGALPVLYAATAPQARAGGYYGPRGPGELTGAPGPARLFPNARDAAAAERLWAASERMTGVVY